MNDLNNDFEETNEDQEETITILPTRKLNLGNDRDRKEYLEQLRAKVIADLYKNDPLIRQSLDAQLTGMDGKARGSTSVVQYGENGNVSGVDKSVIRGTHATTKNQTDLIKALKADAYKRYGVTNG